MALVLNGSNDTITGLQINSSNIVDGSIVNADVNASAAIAASKLSGISTGKILQVVSTTKTDFFSTTSSSLTEITGLNVSITPSASTSKIYLNIDVSCGGTVSHTGFNLKRGSTLIAASTAVSGDNRHQSTFGSYMQINSGMQTVGFNFQDTPNTTSAITYKVFVISQYNNNTVTINRTYNTTNYLYDQGGCSTITAIEVGA